MNDTKAITACECTRPGFCKRHGVRKNAHWLMLCQTRQDYFKLWEERWGPGQSHANQDQQKRIDTQELREAAVELGVIDKLNQYVRALLRWVKAGRPVRTDEEVAAIHSQHCHPCDDYDAVGEVCTICGCKTRNEGMAVRNKIRMATEHCPRKKW